MKKVLTIVLSVAMVICLMPAMAFAADATTTADNTTEATGLAQFSDADSITNKEAVSVLTGLHIINGMGDGTFQPKGDVTRAQTATMISILVRGGDTASLKAPSEDPFTDVAKDNWAAPYVAYGADQGYINGMGDGTYAPNNNVTTAQLATILDQILGYSKADVAYQWPENAMAKANEAGLLVNVNKSANDNLDREEAAQMIFNALKATDVVKSTTTGTNGKTEYVPVKNDSKLDYMGRTSGDEATTEQLVEKLFPKVLYTNVDTDPFGRTSKAWKNGRTQITDDVTETPVLTYTSKQKVDDLTADLKGYKTSGVTVVGNGDKWPNTVDLAAVTGAKNDSTQLADFTGNGKVVELYANEKDNAITKVVVASYVPEKVTEVSSKTGEITLAKYSTSTSPATGSDIVKNDASYYDAIKNVAKDDRVLVAKQGSTGKVIDAYPATSVKGVVSVSTDKQTVTVGETTYNKAANKTDEATRLAANKAEQTLYLDKYNNVVDAELVAEAEKTASNWLYVAATRHDSKTADPYAPTTSTTTTYYIMAVDENGNVINDQALANAAKNNDGSVAADTNAAAPNKVAAGGYYTYKETASGYVLYPNEFNKDKDGIALSSLKRVTGAENTAVTSSTAKLGTNYISKDVNTVTVKGTGSSVSAKAESGASVANKVDYAYVTKTADGRTLVTTIFVINPTTKDTTETTVYVARSTGTRQNYQDSKGTVNTGDVVSYYDADSAEAKTMIAVDPAGTTGFPTAGFYTIKAEGGAFVLTPATPATPATGIVTDSYNGNISIGTAVNALPVADSAIRDTRDADTLKNSDVAQITTVADLDAAVNAKKADGTAKYEVSVDYKTTTNASGVATGVSELYIKAVTPK